MTAAIQLLNKSLPSNIRPLEMRRDLRAVADLVEMCFAETLDTDGRRYIHQMRLAANNPRTMGLTDRFSPALNGYVWEEAGRVVGNLSMLPMVAEKQRSYLIANVAVHPDFRRQGIASSLTETALEFISKRGISSVWLQANANNPIAVGLYKKFGFVERVSRTTWHSIPNAQAVEPSPDISISSRQKRDWNKQLSWLERIYPEEVRWHLAIKLSFLKPGLIGLFNRMFADKRIKQWSTFKQGALIGTLSWQSSFSQADWLWLASSAQHHERAIQSLLPFAQRSLSSHRTLAVNYPAGKAVQTFESVGFRAHKTLVWMHASLA